MRSPSHLTDFGAADWVKAIARCCILIVCLGIVPLVRCVPASAASTLDIRISSGSDDAEQAVGGSSTYLTSTGIDLVVDGSTMQVVGLRFPNVTVPRGAIVSSAYLQFMARDSTSGATSLTIQGQAANNSTTFSSAQNDISARARTVASVGWNPAAWTAGQTGPDQRSVSIAPVIQEIVNRSGWAPGNALSIIITGSGRRTARSYEYNPWQAALLHIEYDVAPPTDTTPPSVPTGVAGTAVSSTQINLSWAASSDDTGVAGYQVFRDGTPIASVPGTSYSDTALSPATFYSYSVAGFDAAGNQSQQSAAVNIQTASQSQYTFVGAGDIATNGSDDERTAKLLDEIVAADPNAVVFTLGDNAYPSGTEAEFADFYQPTWGRHKSRTWPVPGNHEYRTANASGYFTYFGERAGDPGKGYYSYDLGEWHVIALNSEADVSKGSPQEVWLRADLSANPRTCILAYWHSPRFSSGLENGSSIFVQPLWEALYEHGADVVLSGHDHSYERFDLQTPDGVVDPVHGIREFVVGTGGASLYPFRDPLPNSQIRDNSTYGVLKLTLYPDRYDWMFLPIAGNTFTDMGSGMCSTTTPPPPPSIFETRVGAGTDDAEEAVGGSSTYITSSGIDLVNDGSTSQIVGLRFGNVSVPRGAVITDAYIQFMARDTNSSPASLLIKGEASDNSATFSEAQGNISGRPKTTASVSWEPAVWSFSGQATLSQRTPGLGAVIQEIVNRPGWASGNAISLIFTGTGSRTARSFEYNPNQAATLRVAYTTP